MFMNLHPLYSNFLFDWCDREQSVPKRKYKIVLTSLN